MTRPSRSPSSKISSVVSDVNGTLVTDQKLLTERTKAAVAALHRRGIIFSIISAKRGRNFAGSSSLLGNQATVGTGWARRSLRSEHSGKHQVGALAWQVAMDNGARRALVPLENKRNLLEVSGDIVEHVDPIFFSDPMTAAMKALGMT